MSGGEFVVGHGTPLSCRQGPAFDLRPGALEATRIEPASGLTVCGSRKDRRPGKAGWCVLVMIRGEDGTFCQVALPVADARKVAGELTEMADVLDGVVW